MNNGIYYDIDFEIYKKIKALNNSALHYGEKSMLHMYKAINGHFKYNTKWATIGTVTHMALLEPDEFKKKVKHFPKVDGRSKEGRKIKSQKEMLESAGLIVINDEEYEEVLEIQKNVYKHPLARTLLELEGSSEVTFVWNDEWEEENGEEVSIKCKARTDKFTEKHLIITDIKTTKDICDMYNKGHYYDSYGYDTQYAHYTSGVSTLLNTEEEIDFYFVVIDKPTLQVAVCELNEDYKRIAKIKYRTLLHKYWEALSNDKWHGVHVDMQSTMLIPPPVKLVKKYGSL